jgi:biopolymer transport protein ExbD/biopolymer transport protein TolR
MAMDVGGNRAGVRSDINITPLVDVVLVLLIIFMVVTPMLQRGKHVELPKAKHAASAPPTQGREPVFVSVTREGEVFYEQEKTPVPMADLQEKLRVAGAQGKPVMIKADVDTEYGKVRPVLDRASKAKLKGVALAAEQLKDK